MKHSRVKQILFPISRVVDFPHWLKKGDFRRRSKSLDTTEQRNLLLLCAKGSEERLRSRSLSISRSWRTFTYLPPFIVAGACILLSASASITDLFENYAQHPRFGPSVQDRSAADDLSKFNRDSKIKPRLSNLESQIVERYSTNPSTLRQWIARRSRCDIIGISETTSPIVDVVSVIERIINLIPLAADLAEK